MPERRCGTCRWRCGASGTVAHYRASGWIDVAVVECRRMPPTAANQSEENWEGEWPRVNDSGWCGEWAAREEKPDA